MGVQAGLIDTGASEWTAALQTADHDVYHLPGYARLAALEGERPFAFLASAGEHRMLAPLHRRSLPPALSCGVTTDDVASPYGYPGPIWSRGAPEDFIQESLAAFLATLKREGIVTAFIRLHPLLNRPETFAGFGEVVLHGPTVCIDLALSEEALWNQTRRGHRREIIVLEQQGYRATIDEDWSRIDEFLLCYRETMDRREAQTSYYFPKSYFLALKDLLGDRVHLCIVRRDGEVACAGIVTEMNGLAQYHLSGTAHAHLRNHPSKLMLHYLRSWLKARGNRVWHIGGGVGSRIDSLFAFKNGFSPLTAEFHTWRLVCDEGGFGRLMETWKRAAPPSIQPPDSFFPPYRAPIVADAA